MAIIVTRQTGSTAKGSPLTNTELDNNFINLNNALYFDDNVASWAVKNTFAGVGNPTDIFFKPDGTKMFLSTASTLTQYTLTTPWDTTTAGSPVAITNTWDTATLGLFFSPDGTKLITCGQTAVVNAGLSIAASEDRAYYLTLSAPWDLSSTITLVSSLRFGAGIAGLPVAETAPAGITFNSTGTIMYMVGSTNDAVYQYDLTTAYDVSTATYLKQVSIASVETGVTGIRFNTLGTRMYIVGGTTTDSVIEYRLSAAWDIATALYHDELFIGNLEATLNGLFLDESSGNAYVVGTTADLVISFITNTRGILIEPDIPAGRIVLAGETRIKKGNLKIEGVLTLDGSITSGGNITANQISTSSSSITLGGSVTTGNANIVAAQTTGAITIGGTAGTGAITIGQSTATQILNLGTGVTVGGVTPSTKTVNIGTNGASGSTTNINIGSAVSGAINTITINGAVTATSFTGTGSGLTGLNASNITSGTIDAARLPTTSASTTISDSAPASPVAGQMWWNSTTGVLSIYYNDGTSSQWVSTDGGTETPTTSITPNPPSPYSNQYVLTGTTVSALETEIFLNGISDTRIPVALDTLCGYEIDIVARRTDVPGDYAMFQLKSAARNTSGTVANVGNVYEIIVARTLVGLNVDARADDTNNSVNIYVSGIAGQTYSWRAVVNTIET